MTFHLVGYPCPLLLLPASSKAENFHHHPFPVFLCDAALIAVSLSAGGLS